MVLVALGMWLALSAVTAVVCAMVLRGGLEEDRAQGYVSDRPQTPRPVAVAAHISGDVA
jgi:hypothetical protein